VALLATPAIAQTAVGEQPAPAQPGPRTTAYDAAYFAQFAPATALDIVRRVPGFSIEQLNNEVRGFGGAAGNVVFNGARASSKSDSLETILARIPANRVLRVEVGPGDLYGSDFSGKSQVLNVILTAEGGINGNATIKATRNHAGDIVPNAEASVLIRRGNSSINLSGATGRGKNNEEGFDRITAVPGGQLLEFRRKVNTYEPRDPFVSASWGVENAADRAFHVNARWAPSTFHLKQTNLVTPATGPVRDDRLLQNYDTPGYELGGDISRPLARGTIKFVALANRRERETYDASFNRIGGVTVGGFEQLVDSRYDEVLGRLSWARSNLLGLSFELGSELAYNRLDNATELFLLGNAGARTRIDLPIDQAVVDEIRTETYVNAGRQLSRALRLDASLAYETSKLTVSGGDANEKRSLAFLKPSVTLDWKPQGGWHAQLVARRTVAQLNFYDFIANAELAVSRVNGGNANLQPQRAIELRGTLDHPLFGKGLVKLEAGYDRVSKLQDRILTPDGFDAPGNLGTGTRKFASLTLDTPLDALGFKHFQLRSNATVQETSVPDPISGRSRGWSGFWPEWEWNVELRRDAGKFAFGAAISDRDKITFYRTDEVDSNFNGGPYMTAFAEYRPDPKTTVRLDLENVLETAGQRERFFFDPNRSAPLPTIREFRDRNSHVGVTLSLRRGF
jgi:hypothetical protein